MRETAAGCPIDTGSRQATYDGCGRLSVQNQGDSEVAFTHDTASRLAVYRIQDQKAELVVSSELTYDEFGRETARTVKRGEEVLLTIIQEFNTLGLIESRSMQDGHASILRSKGFKYDDYNCLMYYEYSGPQAPPDEQGRLLQSQSFTFDNFDNIANKTTVCQGDQGQKVTTYQYILLDPTQLLKITNDNPEYTPEIVLEYDADGRLTRDEQGRIMDYDTLGRLIRVRDKDQELLCEYRHDAAGKLVAQIAPGQPDTYLFYSEKSPIATKTGESRISYLSDGKTFWGQIVQNTESAQQPES
ncbi:hypothetical protein BDW62DRAFT_204101 [Aspergillus aurantiobrunneus]